MWSNSSRCFEPQHPPPSSGQLQRPPSRAQTARRTAAGMASRGPSRRGGRGSVVGGSVVGGSVGGGSVGRSATGAGGSCGWIGVAPGAFSMHRCAVVSTACSCRRGATAASVVRGFFTCPRDLACFSRSRSSAASSTRSALAPGTTWESPSRAASSFLKNCLLTVTWSRRSSAVRGSTSSRGGRSRAGWVDSTSDVRSDSGSVFVRFPDGAPVEAPRWLAMSGNAADWGRPSDVRGGASDVTTSRNGGDSLG